MTKEELKKEAEVYYSKLSKTEPITIYDYHLSVVACYIASAKPREKQIQIDAKHIRALQKQNGELTDKAKDLEAQIKKMKCCSNCDFFNYRFNDCYYDKECKNKDHWKLRR